MTQATLAALQRAGEPYRAQGELLAQAIGRLVAAWSELGQSLLEEPPQKGSSSNRRIKALLDLKGELQACAGLFDVLLQAEVETACALARQARGKEEQ